MILIEARPACLGRRLQKRKSCRLGKRVLGNLEQLIFPLNSEVVEGESVMYTLRSEFS